MANLIPRSDGAVIPPAETFSRIQTRATNLAADAFRVKSTQDLQAAVGLYQQCRKFGPELLALKGNALLTAYAQEIHPDGASYDIDAAIDVCLAAYLDYVNWFKTNVTNLAKSEIDANGDVVQRTPDMTGIVAKLNAIIATVE